MPTSPRDKKSDTRTIESNRTEMFEREGLDRKGIRRELANVSPLALDDLYVERDDIEFVDPRTTEMPYGPTNMGEFGGSGAETVRIDGDRWKTFRYVAGYEHLAEDATNDDAFQRRVIREQFDFFADANFLTGVSDQAGNTMREGVFSWLKDAIPSARTIDCEDYDGDSGDEDYTGVEENLFLYDLPEAANFRLLDATTPRWDTMIGRKEALFTFNKRSGADGGEAGDTYWSRISAEDGSAGVDSRMVIPEELRFDVLPDDAPADWEPPVVDLTNELAENEVILLPDMDAVRSNYWRLGEMPGLEEFGPYEERGGKTAHDFAWRYSHKFDPMSRYGDAPDAIRLQNVDALFN